MLAPERGERRGRAILLDGLGVRLFLPRLEEILRLRLRVGDEALARLQPKRDLRRKDVQQELVRTSTLLLDAQLLDVVASQSRLDEVARDHADAVRSQQERLDDEERERHVGGSPHLVIDADREGRERLEELELGSPQIPVINNIDVACETDADRMRTALYAQAFGPVRWVECVRAIQQRGVHHIVECGPGKVLAGMVKRIDAEAVSATLFDPASLAEVKGLLA